MINLTPHSITIRFADGSETTIPSAGVARVDSTPGTAIPPIDCPDGMPCYTAPIWGNVIGLPDPEKGVSYLVSALVASRCVGRSDVFSPGTGPKDGSIRDDKGQIIAVTRLIRA